jgi:titin
VLVSGLAAGSKPTFAISAVNSIGSSIAENFATATIPDLPGIPTTLNASVASSTISATWAAPVDNGGSAVTSYTAYLYDSSGNEVTAQRKSDLTTAAAEFTALAAGTYDLYKQATTSKEFILQTMNKLQIGKIVNISFLFIEIQ